MCDCRLKISAAFLSNFIHFFALGCFAGGIYLALHYTLLQPGETKLEDQALAIVSLFPIVS